jgi:hypothetical protein
MLKSKVAKVGRRRCAKGRIEMAENSRKPSTDEQLQQLADSGATLSEIAEMLARAEADTPRLSVNKITWAQVGRVTDPGRYMFTFGWLTISADDLAIWQAHPNAAFTLLRTLTPTTETEAETIDEYRLGTFELRENISLSEK